MNKFLVFFLTAGIALFGGEIKTVESFQNPAAEFHPGYFWYLNGELKESEITRELEDMASHGAKTVCPHPLPKEFRTTLHSTLAPDYLSEEYFKKYEWIVSECERLGMVSWLYDEGGWPSGRACGKVMQKYPGQFYFELMRLDSNGEPEHIRGEGPNILYPGETDAFIALTHEGYKRHIQKHFGKTVRWTFTDEVNIYGGNPGTLPWVPDMEKIFLERKGYDITPHLRKILHAQTDEETIRAKVDFFDVVSQLHVERYYDKLRTWCHQNGMLSGGHMGGEDEYDKSLAYGYTSLLRTLRSLDVPGVDLIWRQLFPGGRRHSFPKLASSVAAQKGTRKVMAELFGVYGNGLTPEQMRYLSNYMLVMGVSSFVYALYPYSTEGPAKGGERPYFCPVNPVWKYMKPYHEEMARLCALNAAGTPCIETALFFPTRSFWASDGESRTVAETLEKTAWKLFGQQTDFDFVDDDVLSTAKVSDGKFTVGAMTYRTLVIPGGSRMAPETEKKIAEFRKAGIPVLSENELSGLPATLRITPADQDFLVRHIHTDDHAEIYFVLNTTGKRLEKQLEFPVQAPIARCDAATGKCFRTNGNTFVFEPYEMLVFAQNLPENALENALNLQGKDVAFELKNLQIRPLRKITADQPGKDYEMHLFGAETPAKPVQFGDWANVLGTDFSGEAVYTAEIISDEMPAELDLGKVCYVANVILNGKDLGTRLYPPYAFDLRSAWKPGVNTLEIRVTNTLANAILPEAVQEVWEKDGSAAQDYTKRCLELERESLQSGIFGPVQLKK